MRDKENRSNKGNGKNNGGPGCDLFRKLVLISKEMAGNDEILIEGIKKQNNKLTAWPAN